MPFGIQQFKSNGMNLNGARPSLFEVIIPNFPLLPTSGTASGISSGPNLVEKVALMAKAASLPGSVVESIDIGYFGRKIKLAGDRVFPNWSINVYNDEDFRVRNVFEDWHELLNSRQPNLLSRATPASGASAGATDPNNYKRDITVIQYSKAGPEKKIYTLIGAFPVTVAPIQLDWDATNQVETFEVEFAYDYWEPVEGNNGTTDGPTPSLTLNQGS